MWFLLRLTFWLGLVLVLLHRFGSADLRQLVRLRRLVAGQEHQHQPEPERQTQQEPHLATRSSVLIVVAPVRRTSSGLTALDKSQVFALRLIRIKFAKNAANWIRRKFSIDGDSCGKPAPGGHAPFRNHTLAAF
jgi:hypothetical protein